MSKDVTCSDMRATEPSETLERTLRKVCQLRDESVQTYRPRKICLVNYTRNRIGERTCRCHKRAAI